MDRDFLSDTVWFFVIYAVASLMTFFITQEHYTKKAVQSGCAVRYLDTLSGDVKTVRKGDTP